MVVEMASLSVKFDTRMYDGNEVVTLYYRANGVFGCKFFTETYNPRTDGVCSAMNNMMNFVFRLMRRGVGSDECFYCL